LKGAELIVYPTAIGSEPNFPDFDSQPMWEKIITSHAIANGVFVAACNRVGFEGTITCYGSSFVADPTGKAIAKASRDQKELLVAELDFDVFNFWRGLFPLLKQRQQHTYHDLVK
jgi:N-carbamoylputrescine amidase